MKEFVRDDGDGRKYFTQIPNMIDDLGLSVYAYRLYGHLKRVAGDDGRCWQNTRTLATACNMGVASVSRAKKELLSHKLIQITEEPNPNGQKPAHIIAVADIWLENAKRFAASFPQEQASSKGEQASSPQEIKNNPVKKNQKKARKKNASVRDERLDHPAIIAYRENARLHVPIVWRDEVIEIVGGKSKEWGELVRSWVGKGWKPGNVEGMLDAFKNEHGSQRPRKPETTWIQHPDGTVEQIEVKR